MNINVFSLSAVLLVSVTPSLAVSVAGVGPVTSSPGPGARPGPDERIFHSFKSGSPSDVKPLSFSGPGAIPGPSPVAISPVSATPRFAHLNLKVNLQTSELRWAV